MPSLDLLIDLHRDGERQGPGSKADTLRALELLQLPVGGDLRIADIGCGTGGQTLTLARKLQGPITAVDLFPEFLEVLNANARKEGLEERIHALQASMDALPFAPEEFDLIWAEGAIYHMGFEAGIRAWRQHLKPGGHLAVSEITWTSNDRSAELEEHWTSEYPEIGRASEKIVQLEASGYTLVGYFILPQASWEQGYYAPLEASLPAFLERHGHSAEARELVRETEKEIRLYRTYRQHFSYGFYLARKER